MQTFDTHTHTNTQRATQSAMHAPADMLICTLLHTQSLCTSSCSHSPALVGPHCAPRSPHSKPSRAHTCFPIPAHVCLLTVSCVMFPVECGAFPARQDLSCASAWPSRKGGIPLARGVGRRKGASRVKSGGNKNVCREAGAVLVDWEQTWASLISLSHHFHFPWGHQRCLVLEAVVAGRGYLFPPY